MIKVNHLFFFLFNTWFRQYPICISALKIRVTFYVARSIKNVATLLSWSCFAVSKRFYYGRTKDGKNVLKGNKYVNYVNIKSIGVILFITYHLYCKVHTSVSMSARKLLLGNIFHLFHKKMFPFRKDLHDISLHTL